VKFLKMEMETAKDALGVARVVLNDIIARITCMIVVGHIH
jgi:hypothetical protein